MRTHLTILCFVALALLPGTASSADAKRPNILFAFADDWGRHASAYAKLDGPGIRVPCLARWPGKIAPGSTTGFISDFADMFPTFAEVAGAKPPAGLDGVSIVPTLLGQPAKQETRDHHYWEAAPAQALRQGDWKVYRGAPDRPVGLYNLATDIGETRNVAAEHPEDAARLEKLMTQVRVESAEFPLAAKKKKKP